MDGGGDGEVDRWVIEFSCVGPLYIAFFRSQICFSKMQEL